METSEKLLGERLRIVLNALGTNATKLATILGVTPSRISNLLLGYSKPNFETLSSIYEVYRNINLHYLYTGEGYPLNVEKVERGLPVAGLSGVSESQADCKKVSVELSGFDFGGCEVFEVLDSGMSPQIQKGQRLVIRRVEFRDWDFLISGVYVVSSARYMVARRVKENDLRNGSLRLYSDSENFGVIELQRSDILNIYEVVCLFGKVE